MVFEGLSEKLQNVIKKIKSAGRVTEKDVKAMMREVRMALLEADVNYKVVKDFISSVSERAVGQDVMESLTPGQQIIKIVHEELINLMGGEVEKLTFSSSPPTVYMMVGLQSWEKQLLLVNLQIILENKVKSHYLLLATYIGLQQ